MIVVNTVSEKYFTLDGVQFARIYQPLAQGSEGVGLYSIFDTKLQLKNSSKYDEFQIDGVVYYSQALTIAALLEVVWSTISESEFQEYKDKVDNLEENQYSGVVVYSTYADEGGGLTFLPTVGEPLVSYKVNNDPDTTLVNAPLSNNGYYSYDGGWIRGKDLPDGEVADGNSNAVSGGDIDKFGKSLKLFVYNTDFINQFGLIFLNIKINNADTNESYYISRLAYHHTVENYLYVKLNKVSDSSNVATFLVADYTITGGIEKITLLESNSSGITCDLQLDTSQITEGYDSGSGNELTSNIGRLKEQAKDSEWLSDVKIDTVDSLNNKQLSLLNNIKSEANVVISDTLGTDVINKNIAYSNVRNPWYIDATFNKIDETVNAGLVYGITDDRFVLNKFTDSFVDGIEYYNETFTAISNVAQSVSGTSDRWQMLRSGNNFAQYYNGLIIDSFVSNILGKQSTMKAGVMFRSKDNRGEFSAIKVVERPEKYAHFSLDDVLNDLIDIDTNSGTYTSIFENANFALIKALHDSHGITCTLNLYYKQLATDGTWSLADMTDAFKSEFEENSHWLKLSFHGEEDIPYPYNDPANNAQALVAWENTYDEIYRFAGESTASTFVRMSYFSGNKDLIDLLKSSKHKLYGLSTADDGRLENTGLNTEERAFIDNADDYYDIANDTYYIKTEPRLDTMSEVEMKELFDGLKSSASEYNVHNLFTHIWALAARYNSIDTLFALIKDNGIRFDFPDNNMPY